MLFEDQIDKIFESLVGSGLTVHQIHVAYIRPVIIFKLSQRDISMVSEAKKYCLEHTDRIISYATELVMRNIIQVLHDINTA